MNISLSVIDCIDCWQLATLMSEGETLVSSLYLSLDKNVTCKHQYSDFSFERRTVCLKMNERDVRTYCDKHPFIYFTQEYRCLLLLRWCWVQFNTCVVYMYYACYIIFSWYLMLKKSITITIQLSYLQIKMGCACADMELRSKSEIPRHWNWPYLSRIVYLNLNRDLNHCVISVWNQFDLFP